MSPPNFALRRKKRKKNGCRSQCMGTCNQSTSSPDSRQYGVEIVSLILYRKRPRFGVNSEFTQQDGRKKRTAKQLCDKRDRAITCGFCRDLHLTPRFSRPLQKDLFKGKWSLAKSCFKQNCCHGCHTRFAVLFPLPSCCVSSLIEETQPRSQGTFSWPASKAREKRPGYEVGARAIMLLVRGNM